MSFRLYNILPLLFLPFLPGVAAQATSVDGYTYVVRDRLEQALDLPLPRFVLDVNDTLLFADDLRHAAGVALCVEIAPLFPLAPPPETEDAPPADAEPVPPVELENTTPRRILDAFTAARPEYIWMHLGGNRVNLLPKAYVEDPEWRGHFNTGTWDMPGADVGAYFKKIATLSFQTAQPLMVSTETQHVQPLWANHPRLLRNRTADIQNREATLLEALDATAVFGADFVWTSNGSYYGYEAIALDEVYPAAFQRAEAYRRQPDAEQATAIALYQMAFEEAPYADLQVRVGMAIMEVYLGRSMPNATPQLQQAAQMCRLLLDAQPKYPYDATLWQQYLTLLHQMGRQNDAQWAVRAHCPPGAPPDSYPCVQAKQLMLWMATLYATPEEQMAYLISKQNVFPDDPRFNDELDARVFAIQRGIDIANTPPHNPYAQFNRRPEPEEDSAEKPSPATHPALRRTKR